MEKNIEKYPLLSELLQVDTLPDIFNFIIEELENLIDGIRLKSHFIYSDNSVNFPFLM